MITVLDAAPVKPRHVAAAGLEHVVGDLADPEFMQSVFSTRKFDSVFHLAAVLSGQSELDFDLGMKVNVDATRTLLDLCRKSGLCPKFVMTSSIAVFGAPSASGITPEDHSFTEDTNVLPRSSYGTEKAICELMLLDTSRRSFVDARAVRLPTVIVRPGSPNSATSSFCSSIIREPLNGERAVCPVARDLPLWVQSPEVVVQNLIHAHNIELGRASPIITLPGLTTTPYEMVEALAVCGGDTSLVSWEPDDFLNRVVSSWPGCIKTPTADKLGFQRDRDILSIVQQYKLSLNGSTTS